MLKRGNMNLPIPIDRERIALFCQTWNIAEFALFGSVLRDEFGPDSDIDVLVTFRPEAHPTLFDLARMQEELSAIFGRHVDLLTRPGVEQSRNEIRRREILSTAEVIHAA